MHNKTMNLTSKPLMTQNPFHVVELSPWPLNGATGALLSITGLAFWFHLLNILLLLMSFSLTILTMLQLWRDVIRESTFQGFHTSNVLSGLWWGMILLIFSSICFFLTFSWAYFHSSLAPTMEIGFSWPPTGVTPINLFQVPLLDTVVLLASGVLVTWAYHALMQGTFKEANQGLFFTSILWLYFTFLQAGEYKETSLTISDSAYGSTFVVETGFQSSYSYWIHSSLNLPPMNNIPALFIYTSLWVRPSYWHFVDTVWLFLYTCIYWWDS